MTPPDVSSRAEDIIPSPSAHTVFVPSGVASRKFRTFLDRLASGVVWVGGVGTILCVLGIFVYLLLEVAPLFLASTGSQQADVPLANVSSEYPQNVLVGVDEYKEVAYLVHQGRIEFYQLPSGTPIPFDQEVFPFSDRVTTVARSHGGGHTLAMGTRDGQIIPVQIRLRPTFKDGERTIVPGVSIGETIEAIPTQSSVSQLAFQEMEDGITLAAVTQVGDVWLTIVEKGEGLMMDQEPVVTQVKIGANLKDQVSGLLLDGLGETLLISTRDGHLLHWNVQDPDNPTLVKRYTITSAPDFMTAMAFLIGDRTLVVGTKKGMVSTLMPRRNPQKPNVVQFYPARSFESHNGAITAISSSRRDKGFLTSDNQGTLKLHHSTSGQTLLHFEVGDGPVETIMFAPKANGAIALDGNGKLHVLDIDNPHPEITLRTLFRPVLYEGYEHRQYIWQSSSGSDDFEPKFGMVPLIFGTLKGTMYAMLLAVPLAVMGAIYTGMFMPPKIREVVKPIIETMAALPSVVLGFLAGLWLAPLLEQIFPAVIGMLVVMPLAVTIACIGWQFVPKFLRQWDRFGIDLIILIAVLGATAVGCLVANQAIESWFFESDYQSWLLSTFDLAYDQRNALVISFAMGFAVIPIIFSISEDSISNVPKHLIAGSLAMGATQWQTLTRLVLISASPGIFSALMIGFGRAVGETMIVLMATGNTPILEWSIFNGFRTLSANIAVEIPEAPQGGSLYRTLFLSALLLFAFTFLINTIGEVVRQRLRTKYSQY